MKAFRAFEFWLRLVAVLPLLPAELNAQNGLPRPDHVVVVVEENKGFGRIFNSPEAPYINSLAAQGALFISSFAVRHPSEPNYLALFSGSTQGVGDDSCPHSFNRPNLGSALIDAGLTFAGYSESMPQAGYLGCETGTYARRHNPWSNFPAIPAEANLPFTAFPTNYADLPSVAFVVPNLGNDMHDGPIQRGDDWLQEHLDGYIQWAQTHNSLFVLTWDEGSGNNQIATLMVGPMVRPGEYCERIDHYTVLRTLLDMFRLTPFGSTTNVDAITSAWRPETVDSPINVAITSPEDGHSLTAPFILRVDASSSEGSIAQVEFFEGPTKLGIVTEPPFDLSMSSVVAGPHCYVAKAMNTDGARRTSTSIQITVTSSSPHALAAASYSGLFFETNRIVNDHAGSLDIVVNSQSALSARVARGGHQDRATGKFSADGSASLILESAVSNQVVAELHLGLPPNDGLITGRILGDGWEAPLVAYRSDFTADHPSALTGRYTLRLTGSTGDEAPRGDGVMAASIGRDGKVTLMGTLADGTKIVQHTSSSPGGDIPFYRSLYHNGGSIIGWLKFTPNMSKSAAGDVVWTKPAIATDSRYPMGFQIASTAEAADYSFQALTNELATATNLKMTVDLGQLLVWTNAVSFNLSSRRLTDEHGSILTLAAATGLWSGRYMDPVTRKSWPMNATVLQGEELGAGYVLTPERSGRIMFGPSP
jgi:acid phosphatase